MLCASSEVTFRKNLDGSRTQGLGPPSNSISLEEPRVTRATAEGSTACGRRREARVGPRGAARRQRAHGRRRLTPAHLEGQVGRDGDAGAQVHVAVLVADEQRGVALGLGSHPDAAAVLGPRGQPPCRRGRGHVT